MQARILASVFPERAKGITSNPREDLVVELFGRVTDVDNFYVVLATLGRDAQPSVGRRLGWLNALNPHHMDRCRRAVTASLSASCTLSSTKIDIHIDY